MRKQLPDWFRNAVFYEIYPQSFCDSNGDGIGDFQGIIDKLDYVKSLNVDAIWLNPCFDSPFQDAGYDVRDYCKTAARYGTNEDLKRLMKEAHRRGLRVLLDLVPGHTSIESKWFKAAASRETTPYDRYYNFTDGWGEETDGYKFISGYGDRDGYYMINFFYSQPALNYGFVDPKPQCSWQLPVNHPDVVKVREEIRNVMKFWLDAGCDGFRVDMAFSLVRASTPELRDQGLLELWHDYSGWLKKYAPDAVLVAEGARPAFAAQCGFDSDFELGWSTGENPVALTFRREQYKSSRSNELCADTPRSFFSRQSCGNSRTLLERVLGYMRQERDARFSLITGNHDVPRIRRGREMADLKVIYTFLFTMPGRPFLYYGDEIGMDYVGEVGNVEGSYERGGSRTPMQWAPGEKAGFSTAEPEKFYTMLDPSANRPNVEDEEKDPESLLNFTRRLLALRHQYPALGAEGKCKLLVSEMADAPLVYLREDAAGKFLIAVNPDARPRTEEIAAAPRAELLAMCGHCELQIEPGVGKLTMDGVSAAIWKLELLR